MAISENLANIHFGIQSAKGSAASTSDYALYMAGGTGIVEMRTDETFEETTGIRMRDARFASEVHAGGVPEFYVVPNAAGALFYGALGAKAVTGASDPYTHTFTPATSRPWFTFWQHIGDMLYTESRDCKVDQLVLSGESGQPLRIAATIMGLDPRYQSAAEATATVETTNRFLHYDGVGALELEGSAFADIRAFTLTIANNGELIPGDALIPIDISEGELTVSLEITKLALDTDFRDRLYYGTDSPTPDDVVVADILELGGTPSVDFTFTRVAAAPGPERSLQIALPRVALAPFEVQPGTGNTPLTESITLEALQPSGDDAIDAVVVNGQATY